MILDLNTAFSRGWSDGLVFPSLSEFSTVYCDPHSQGFGIVNKAEIDVFLELSCFFHDPADVGNLISGSSVFSKTSLNIREFMVHILLKPDRMWSTGEGNGKPLQYSCLENPMNSRKRQNDKIPKEELPRSVGAQYDTLDQ